MAELLCVLQVFRWTCSCRSPGCSKIHFVVNTFYFLLSKTLLLTGCPLIFQPLL